MSWWDLGEGYGCRGDEFDGSDIACAFCEEKGQWNQVFHAEKKKPNHHKVLNFDTYECANCKGYLMVLWSSNLSGLYDFKILPWLQKTSRFPEHWPGDVGRYWLQAVQNIDQENWDAAALMVCSCMQLTLRHAGAKGSTLYQEVEDLKSKGLLPPTMAEWANEIRLIRNPVAHPSVSAEQISASDVVSARGFLDFLIRYVFELPHGIERLRKKDQN